MFPSSDSEMFNYCQMGSAAATALLTTNWSQDPLQDFIMGAGCRSDDR